MRLHYSLILHSVNVPATPPKPIYHILSSRRSISILCWRHHFPARIIKSSSSGLVFVKLSAALCDDLRAQWEGALSRRRSVLLRAPKHSRHSEIRLDQIKHSWLPRGNISAAATNNTRNTTKAQREAWEDGELKCQTEQDYSLWSQQSCGVSVLSCIERIRPFLMQL